MAMKKLFLILVLLVFLSGCAAKQASDEGQQLANPASVHCEEHGGTLRIVDGEEGQYGVCTLPNGTECEEWAYYGGECP
jgi:putative hemolysin